MADVRAVVAHSLCVFVWEHDVGRGGVRGVFPWQPDQGQHVTLFYWASVLPYANEACASLQTLALVSLCLLSSSADGKSRA